MRRNNLIFTLIVIGLFITSICMFSCKHEVIIPSSPVISFSSQVMPAILGNCAQSGCHNGKIRTKLGNYDEVMQDGGVLPGNPSGSRLYTDIISYKMPRSPYPPLTDQQTAIIYVWILQGALNN
jgi:hypothetical protein